MLRPSSSRLSLLRTHLLVLAVPSTALLGCATTRAPALAPTQTTSLELTEEVQPPTLPIEPANEPLPVLAGRVPVEVGLRAAAAVSTRVQLRLLLISPTSDNPGLAALEALCDQVGVPCDSFVAATTPLTSDRLVAADGAARYQGVLLTDNQLAYETNGGYQSAFDAAEWNLLWEYERDYAIRQVSLYTYPGSFPESYGLSVAGYQDTTAAPYGTTLTAAGKGVFSSLKQDLTLPLRYAYTYLARVDAASGVAATPLLQDAAGNVLAATTTSLDGRERLALTMAHNPYLLHTQLVGYDLLRWVTKGIFIGQRQFYLGIDQDDWFGATDRWDATYGAGGISGTYRLNAQDVASVVAQQRKLRSDYPVADDFAWTMAFNGLYANPTAPLDCNVATLSADPLTSLTRCYKNEFLWLNHTYSHPYMDAPTTYTTALNEIVQNTTRAYRLGLINSRYPLRSLVTGDVSGLGWYAPGGPGTGAKVDFGLNASNREFLRAAKRSGVRYLASNMSVGSHEPTGCWGCGITHPLESSILLVPRWPTNLFATPTTPVDMMNAYNGVYGPGGSSPYFAQDLSYEQYLSFEADIALYHVITGSPYQHYQHVGNLREYAPGRSLAYDWVDRLLATYSRYYTQPLETLPWDVLGKTVVERTSFRKAGISGVWDSATNQLSFTSANGGTLMVTQARPGQLPRVIKTSLGAGATKTYLLR